MTVHVGYKYDRAQLRSEAVGAVGDVLRFLAAVLIFAAIGLGAGMVLAQCFSSLDHDLAGFVQASSF